MPPLKLELLDPALEVSKLQLGIENIRYHDTEKGLSGGTLTARIGSPVAGLLPLNLTASGLTASGTFDVPVRLIMPGFAPQRFTLVMTAKDAPFLPWLVILLGVAGSYGIRYAAQRFGPQQRLLARLFILKRTIRMLLAKISDPIKANELRRKLDDLDNIQGESEAGDLTELDARLTTIGERVRIIQDERAADATVLYQDFNVFDRTLAAEELWPPLEKDERTRLESFLAQLRDGRTLVREEKLDEARQLLDGAQRGLDLLRAERIRRFLRLILASPPPAEANEATAFRDHLESERDRILALVNENKLADARNALRELADFVTTRIPVAPPGLEDATGRERDVADTVQPTDGLDAELVTRAAGAQRSARISARLVDLASVLIASFTGFSMLYSGKPFGTGNDYLIALLWGFGIDNAVHGVGDVISRLTGARV